MGSKRPMGRKASYSDTLSGRNSDDFRALSHRMLEMANRRLPRIDFLREMLDLLRDFSHCDSVGLWLHEEDHYIHCAITDDSTSNFHYENIPYLEDKTGHGPPSPKDKDYLKRLRELINELNSAEPTLLFTKKNSFWVDDFEKLHSFWESSVGNPYAAQLNPTNKLKSLMIAQLIVGDDHIGFMQLGNNLPGAFMDENIKAYERIAQTLSIALVNQRAQAALRERIKELSCLYSIAQIKRHTLTLGEILQEIVELIPPAWQYPEITGGRIILDGNAYMTADFRDDCQKQIAEIFVKGQHRGTIEVTYGEAKPELDEGPFLQEERNLINAIARQVGLIVERKKAEEHSAQLQEQLRHADRLATIGQLAAGVAHELNEPLGNILGFAQLAQKGLEQPAPARNDIDKIIKASLHAREIIKKLMIFARQMPAATSLVNLNKLVEEGLFFFEARCAKAGISLNRSLAPGIPEIMGDQSQLLQVLVNLVVNSIQAMPDGGNLNISTGLEGDSVFLAVEDTGIGMDESTLQKIFIPFFTTKDVNEGTGLGLSVVHGIVTSHGGTVEVTSEPGGGACFRIHLPIKTGMSDGWKDDHD